MQKLSHKTLISNKTYSLSWHQTKQIPLCNHVLLQTKIRTTEANKCPIILANPSTHYFFNCSFSLTLFFLSFRQKLLSCPIIKLSNSSSCGYSLRFSWDSHYIWLNSEMKCHYFYILWKRKKWQKCPPQCCSQYALYFINVQKYIYWTSFCKTTWKKS